MAQTMGKRIMENRKRLKLTQDQLAEQLGVTPQAVSKWENDQSCPDISMLPRLAEIFGISTDELLGRMPQTVHEAEVITEEAEEQDGIHIRNDIWNLHWNSGRKEGIAFSCFVLLVGILTLLSKIFLWNVSFWNILWPSALLVFGLDGLFPKFSFFRLGCTIFGGYFLVSNLDIWKLSIAGELIFPIIIVLFGISLLVDAIHKPRKPKFQITRNDDNICDQNGKTAPKSHFNVDGDAFECSVSFGDSARTVTIPRLSSGDISCSFGDLSVDLSGCAEIAEDCKLAASCSFGELTILIPRKYRVEPNSSTSFASLSFEGHPDPDPISVIHLDATVNFGNIEIKYI